MIQETINCPNCGEKIQISTVLAQEIEKGIDNAEE